VPRSLRNTPSNGRRTIALPVADQAYDEPKGVPHSWPSTTLHKLTLVYLRHIMMAYCDAASSCPLCSVSLLFPFPFQPASVARSSYEAESPVRCIGLSKAYVRKFGGGSANMTSYFGMSSRELTRAKEVGGCWLLGRG